MKTHPAPAAHCSAAPTPSSHNDTAKPLRILSLVVLLSVPLNGAPAFAICEGDFNDDNVVRINELVRAVGNALNGCPEPLPTSTATSTETLPPTASPTPTETASPSPTHTQPPSCGDGHSDTDEECDGRDLNNQSCGDVTSGSLFGTLSCTDDCRFDISNCSDTRFGDLGNGAIRDNQVGLMWDKKCSVCDNLHDVSNRYPWHGTCAVSNNPCQRNDDCDLSEICEATDGQGTGLTVFQWVDTLNSEQFAGFSDWRLPTLDEIETIRNLSTLDPATFTDFHRNACPDLTDPACSRTGSSNYWSATPQAGKPASAWSLNFDEGSSEAGDTTDANLARAVRGESHLARIP